MVFCIIFLFTCISKTLQRCNQDLKEEKEEWKWGFQLNEALNREMFLFPRVNQKVLPVGELE